MDLSKFETRKAADTGADLHLISPIDGQPLFDDETGEPVTIQLVGRDSQVFQRALHDQQTKRIRRSAAVGRMRVSGAEIEAEGISLLVHCTRGWSGIDEGGEPLEFSTRNAKRLYTDYPWIREQVDAFINDRSNFLGN